MGEALEPDQLLVERSKIPLAVFIDTGQTLDQGLSGSWRVGSQLVGEMPRRGRMAGKVLYQLERRIASPGPGLHKHKDGFCPWFCAVGKISLDRGL